MCPVVVHSVEHSDSVEDDAIIHSKYFVSLSHCAGRDGQQEEQTGEPFCEQIIQVVIGCTGLHV